MGDGLLGAAAREGGTAPELGGTAASGMPFTAGSRASSARVGPAVGGAGSTEPSTGTEASATVPPSGRASIVRLPPWSAIRSMSRRRPRWPSARLSS